jgi:ribosomal protein S25
LSEEWRPIAGHDGYEVSNLGRVRCWRPRNWVSKPPAEPRQVKPSPSNNGYLRVRLGKDGGTRTVHTLVAGAFVERPVGDFEVAHENGNRHDNRSYNLRWKTRKDNHADKRKHGTHGRKLTQEQVDEIRSSYVPNVVSMAKVGERFGVNHSTVHKIVRHIYWKEVS